MEVKSSLPPYRYPAHRTAPRGLQTRGESSGDYLVMPELPELEGED
jgi:hypothetical protein